VILCCPANLLNGAMQDLVDIDVFLDAMVANLLKGEVCDFSECVRAFIS